MAAANWLRQLPQWRQRLFKWTPDPAVLLSSVMCCSTMNDVLYAIAAYVAASLYFTVPLALLSKSLVLLVVDGGASACYSLHQSPLTWHILPAMQLARRCSRHVVIKSASSQPARSRQKATSKNIYKFFTPNCHSSGGNKLKCLFQSVWLAHLRPASAVARWAELSTRPRLPSSRHLD